MSEDEREDMLATLARIAAMPDEPEPVIWTSMLGPKALAALFRKAPGEPFQGVDERD